MSACQMATRHGEATHVVTFDVTSEVRLCASCTAEFLRQMDGHAEPLEATS